MSDVTMETRQVLDSESNIIGSLSLPEGTSEAEWSSKLAELATMLAPPSGVESVNSLVASATSSTTTSNSNPAVIEGMILTPQAGKFLIMFSGSVYTGGASAAGEFGLYKNNVLIPETRREVKCSLQLLGGLVSVSLNTIGVGTYTGTAIEVNGTDVITAKFKSNNGGVIGFGERVLSMVRV